MNIISILDGRASAGHPACQGATTDPLWPPDVKSITYVIGLEPRCDKVIAYAIDVDAEGRALFALAVDRASLPGLIDTIWWTIETRATGVLPTKPSRPRPGDPPWLDREPLPGPGHPVIELAMSHHALTRRFEQQLGAARVSATDATRF